MFDLISSQYHWDDEQILDRPLRRLRQIVAGINLRLWAADLAARRLATTQLRTVCAYIASTVQLQEGADNVMLTHAAHLDLGPGTGNPNADPTPAPPAAPGGGPQAMPGARIAVDDLPDAPPGIRPGQPTPLAGGVRAVPLADIGRLFGGGL